jgi:hypothetical protein
LSRHADGPTMAELDLVGSLLGADSYDDAVRTLPQPQN